MITSIDSILICDPVDVCCDRLLMQHGISVTRKFKLSKDDLIAELKVSSELKMFIRI